MQLDRYSTVQCSIPKCSAMIEVAMKRPANGTTPSWRANRSDQKRSSGDHPEWAIPVSALDDYQPSPPHTTTMCRDVQLNSIAASVSVQSTTTHGGWPPHLRFPASPYHSGDSAAFPHGVSDKVACCPSAGARLRFRSPHSAWAGISSWRV